MKNKPNKNIYPQKSLSGGSSAILRPLYNSNMAKVSIVAWSDFEFYHQK